MTLQLRVRSYTEQIAGSIYTFKLARSPMPCPSTCAIWDRQSGKQSQAPSSQSKSADVKIRTQQRHHINPHVDEDTVTLDAHRVKASHPRVRLVF